MSTQISRRESRSHRFWLSYAFWLLPIVIFAAMATLGGFIRYGHTHELRYPPLIGLLLIAVVSLIWATASAAYVMWILNKVRQHEVDYAYVLANKWTSLVSGGDEPFVPQGVIAPPSEPTTELGKAFRDNDQLPGSVDALREALTTGSLRAITPAMVPGSPVAFAAIAEEKIRTAEQRAAKAAAIEAAQHAYREAAEPVAAPYTEADVTKDKGDGGAADAPHIGTPEQEAAAELAPAPEPAHTCPVHGGPGLSVNRSTHPASPCSRGGVEVHITVAPAPSEAPTSATSAPTPAPLADTDPHRTEDLGRYKDPRRSGAQPQSGSTGEMFSGAIPTVRARAAEAAHVDYPADRRTIDAAPVTGSNAIVADCIAVTGPIPTIPAPEEAPAEPASYVAEPVVEEPVQYAEPVQYEQQHVEPVQYVEPTPADDDVPAALLDPPAPEPAVDEVQGEFMKMYRHSARQFIIKAAPARTVLGLVTLVLVLTLVLIGGQSLVQHTWPQLAVAMKWAVTAGAIIGGGCMFYMLGPGMMRMDEAVNAAYPEYTPPPIDKGARITLIVWGLLAAGLGYVGVLGLLA